MPDCLDGPPAAATMRDALMLLSGREMPQDIRRTAIMLRLMMDVPTTKPGAAADILFAMDDDLQWIVDRAGLPYDPSATFASDEQAVVMHIQDRCGVDLGIDTGRWARPHSFFRADMIAMLGRALFLQLAQHVRP